jgi:hypothetical protein
MHICVQNRRVPIKLAQGGSIIVQPTQAGRDRPRLLSAWFKMSTRRIIVFGTLGCILALFLASSLGEEVHDLTERAKVRAFLDMLSANGAKVDNIDIKISNVGGRGLYAANAIKVRSGRPR